MFLYLADFREEAVQRVVHQRCSRTGHGSSGQTFQGQWQQRRERLSSQTSVTPLHHQPRQLAYIWHRDGQLQGPGSGPAQAPTNLQLIHNQPRELAHLRHREQRQGAHAR